MKPTVDPEVFIESCDGDSITYQRSDGLRWRVTGQCDKRGFCMLGAVVTGPDDKEVIIKSVEQLNKLAKKWNRIGHIQSDEPLDVPTNINYDGSCCPFTVEVLD